MEDLQEEWLQFLIGSRYCETYRLSDIAWSLFGQAPAIVTSVPRRRYTAFPSQVEHDGFDEEVFAGLARLRGMECRAQYAEAFTTPKATLTRRLTW